MKFNIDNYKGKYVMHCKTEEEKKDFCDYLHSVGRKWKDGRSYSRTTGIFGNEYYFFNEGTVGTYIAAKNEGYTILEWEDFMNKEFTKADLKTGDVVRRRCGDVEIVNGELETLICKTGGWNNLDAYNNDLTNSMDCDYDIMEVRRPKKKSDCCFDAFAYEWGTLVYERKEPEEMTLEQVCKLLGKEIKIIP